MLWLLNSQGVKNYKSTASFCHSILAIYTNDWSIFWYDYCCYANFFSGKFLNECKPITHPLWQSGPAGLAFYGTGAACLPSSRLTPFHVIKNVLANEIYNFSRLSPQTGCLFTWAAFSTYNQLLIQQL